MSTYVSGVPTSVRIATVLIYISAALGCLVGLLGLLTGNVVISLVLIPFSVVYGVLASRVSEGDRRSRDIVVGLLVLALVLNIFVLDTNLLRALLTLVLIGLLTVGPGTREFFEAG